MGDLLLGGQVQRDHGVDPPGSVTSRSSACGDSTGRICSVFADSGHSLSAGTNPGVTATTNVASRKATMWSVVLAPAS